MKILVIGESLSMPTGFGNQMNILIRGLHARGNELFSLSSAGKTTEELPEGITEWTISNAFDQVRVDRSIRKIKPDLAIIFWYNQLVSALCHGKELPGNCPVLLWPAWEGSTLPADAEKMFHNIPKNRVAHLSNFAQDMWKDIIPSDVVIPHAIDLEIFKPSELDKGILRRKWSEKFRFPLFEDSFIVLNLDRNVYHKRWDATYDYISRLSKVFESKVQLVAHTQASGSSAPSGFDLKVLEKAYKIEGQVCYTDFDWNNGLTTDELIELYSLCDVRISTSEGEGFGIPTIEAGALKVPQILNNHTTMPELVGPDSMMLVDPAFAEYSRESLWQVPDVAEMVNRTCRLHPYVADSKRRRRWDTFVDETYEHIVNNFSSTRILDMWERQINTALMESPPIKCWYENRWGYNAGVVNRHSIRNLAMVTGRFAESKRILEIGSFKGEYLDFALELGEDVIGIEPDVRALDQMSPRAKTSAIYCPYEVDWPEAQVVVLTDVFPLMVKGVPDATSTLRSLLSRLTKYPWIIFRRNQNSQWGTLPLDLQWLDSFLEGLQIVRRPDLEENLKEKFAPNFSHEIWQNHINTSIVPEGVLQVYKTQLG